MVGDRGRERVDLVLDKRTAEKSPARVSAPIKIMVRTWLSPPGEGGTIGVATAEAALQLWSGRRRCSCTGAGRLGAIA
jgi:hypothetical protein